MANLFCSKCGKKMVRIIHDIQPVKITINTQTAWWLDPSTESILQSKECQRMSFQNNDLFDENTGKKKQEQFIICPRHNQKDRNHDVKRVVVGSLGIITYERV